MYHCSTMPYAALCLKIVSNLPFVLSPAKRSTPSKLQKCVGIHDLFTYTKVDCTCIYIFGLVLVQSNLLTSKKNTLQRSHPYSIYKILNFSHMGIRNLSLRSFARIFLTIVITNDNYLVFYRYSMLSLSVHFFFRQE